MTQTITLADNIGFNFKALRAYPVRTALILLAIAIGVTAVVLLTSLGEGARLYISAQFQSLGTNLLIVIPGKTETTGGLPPLTGATPRDLTLEDAIAVHRHPLVAQAAPLVFGNVLVSFSSLSREISLVGSTPDLLKVLNLQLAAGQIWTANDPYLNSPVCLLGYKLKQELFGNQSALGVKIRIGDSRFRVLGVLKDKGQTIGMDFSNMLILPVSNAMTLFNTPSLYRIMVSSRRHDQMQPTLQAVKATIKTRHNDKEDITVLTQDALLSTFDDILRALTYAIAAIGAISLIVAGILIMNVMLVSVNQRQFEIGLLKALGASTRKVMQLFLGEALLLSIAGGVAGVILSWASLLAIQTALPEFPIATPLWAWVAVTIVTMISGLLFGAIPARKAARLPPVEALAG